MKKKIWALALGGIVGISAVLGGCGGKSGSADAGEVYVYNWGEYIDEEVISMFEKETGIKVIYDMF